MPTYADLKAFIVHGHDHDFRDNLLNVLQTELGMPAPTVLDGVANMGLTIIEKFEQEASKCDLALVLLTPDDFGRSGGGAEYRTARPNVWFELGYFMALFGRRSGRTILLYKEGVEIPTDLAGIVYIKATDELAQGRVPPKLRHELNALLNEPERQIVKAPVRLSGSYRVRGVLDLTGT